jgi:hypothetical protein
MSTQKLMYTPSKFVSASLREGKERKGVKMTLQEAINTSVYKSAITEYNGMYTNVDGSLLNGNFVVTTGVLGMPPTEHQEVSGIEQAVKAIQEKGLSGKSWEPVGESES